MSKVHTEAYSFPDTMIINMDETPLYFDIPCSHSVHRKGCREVHIRSTGADKRCLTVILACTAARDMLPPMVIFNGKTALKNLYIPAGVIVAVQSKAWNDAALTKIWIQKVLCRYTQKQHALMVWDTFSGHMTEDAAVELQKNITIATIPGDCTIKIQPLDVFEQTLQEQMSQPVGGIHAATSRPARARRVPEASIKAASC